PAPGCGPARTRHWRRRGRCETEFPLSVSPAARGFLVYRFHWHGRWPREPGSCRRPVGVNDRSNPMQGVAPAVEPGPDLFRLLVDRVKDYAIFALDPQGIVVSWNAGAERIKGYRAHEIVGHHFSRFYPEEAVRSGWPQTELELATRQGSFEDQGWRVRKDGSRFWANVVITALHDDHGALRGFAKVTRDMTEAKRMERLEADARQMSDFVAMLAHELRNPLAPIRNAVQLAQHRLDDPERMAWALGIIERQTRQLTRL